MTKKALVLLSGCGVYDGSEIHEATLCLLELKRNNIDYHCAAPDIDQHHVINHLNGEELKQKRNVLIESARIARGEISSLNNVSISDYDALVIPGGFGAAKNLTKWAFAGPDGEINDDVKRIIVEALEAEMPIFAICMSPTVIARALQGSGKKTILTVGTTKSTSPYDIAAISQGIEKTGAVASMKAVNEISFDAPNRIITSPCYMMEADIVQIHEGIALGVQKLKEII